MISNLGHLPLSDCRPEHTRTLAPRSLAFCGRPGASLRPHLPLPILGPFIRPVAGCQSDFMLTVSQRLPFWWYIGVSGTTFGSRDLLECAMPIFEYQCSACGGEFEQLVVHSSPLPGCPSCGSQDLEKMMSISSVSSEKVRRRASLDIRARNRALRKDHSHEEVKRLEAHAQDHDD